MISFPHAKINLGLHVTGRRPDGFHDIETLFYPVSLTDVLEIVPSDEPGFILTTSGLPIPGDPSDNLVMKAVRVLEGNGRIGCRIHLHKVIPFGAGLGGGSSDAAFALGMLNELWNLGLSREKLMAFAGELGSDCPFFILNSPAFGTGKGNRLEPVELALSGYRIEVRVPPVFVSTPEAYSLITPRKPDHSLQETMRRPIEEWKELLVNDFEGPVMQRYPVIREYKERLYREGALYASMSGSGSAVYGIFPDRKPEARSQKSEAGSRSGKGGVRG